MIYEEFSLSLQTAGLQLIFNSLTEKTKTSANIEKKLFLKFIRAKTSFKKQCNW